MDPLLIGDARWEFRKQVTFPSGKFICMDPQNAKDAPGLIGENQAIRKVQSKTWDAWVLIQYEDFLGWRVARLVLTVPGERPIYEYKEGTCLTTRIDVDSGSAGFFDLESILNCQLGDSIENDLCGVCAQSGLGDGSYELWSLAFPSRYPRQYTLVFLEEAAVKL